MKQWIHRAVMVGLAGLAIVALLPLTATVAHATTREGSYAQSDGGKLGTGATMILPYNIVLPHSDDQIAGGVFLYTDANFAIETGLGYGYDLNCGTQYYWSPYATYNDGYPEDDDCSYSANADEAWMARSFVNNGTAFSFFDDQYGTPIWAVNWGSDPNLGQLYDQTEVHVDNDTPTFQGSLTMYSEQQYNGNTWYSWPYTDVYSFCPYPGVYETSTQWYTYDSGC